MRGQIDLLSKAIFLLRSSSSLSKPFHSSRHGIPSPPLMHPNEEDYECIALSRTLFDEGRSRETFVGARYLINALLGYFGRHDLLLYYDS